MTAFVIDNALLILMILFMICVMILGGVLIKKGKGDGKLRKIGGWLLFSGLWPVIDKDANRDVSKFEIIITLVVAAFLIGALIYNSL